jgi:predicted transposase/invertase (TIGR01784 family)
MKDRYINPFTEKLFSIAEIARFSPVEVKAYEDSLKVYRDLKSSIDTAREEGKAEGKADNARRVAAIMIKEGEDDSKIVRYTGLSIETVREIRGNTL